MPLTIEDFNDDGAIKQQLDYLQKKDRKDRHILKQLVAIMLEQPQKTNEELSKMVSFFSPELRAEATEGENQAAKVNELVKRAWGFKSEWVANIDKENKDEKIRILKELHEKRAFYLLDEMRAKLGDEEFIQLLSDADVTLGMRMELLRVLANVQENELLAAYISYCKVIGPSMLSMLANMGILHHFAEKNCANVILQFRDEKVNLTNFFDSKGKEKTAMQLAAENDNAEAIKALWQLCSSDTLKEKAFKSHGNYGAPLQLAAERGGVAAIKAIEQILKQSDTPTTIREQLLSTSNYLSPRQHQGDNLLETLNPKILESLILCYSDNSPEYLLIKSRLLLNDGKGDELARLWKLELSRPAPEIKEKLLPMVLVYYPSLAKELAASLGEVVTATAEQLEARDLPLQHRLTLLFLKGREAKVAALAQPLLELEQKWKEELLTNVAVDSKERPQLIFDEKKRDKSRLVLRQPQETKEIRQEVKKRILECCLKMVEMEKRLPSFSLKEKEHFLKSIEKIKKQEFNKDDELGHPLEHPLTIFEIKDESGKRHTFELVGMKELGNCLVYRGDGTQEETVVLSLKYYCRMVEHCSDSDVIPSLISIIEERLEHYLKGDRLERYKQSKQSAHLTTSFWDSWTRDQYTSDAWAAYSDYIHPIMCDYTLQIILSIPEKELNVLELCGGTGKLASEILGKSSKKLLYTLLEYNDPSLEEARKALQQSWQNNSRAAVVKTDIVEDDTFYLDEKKLQKLLPESLDIALGSGALTAAVLEDKDAAIKVLKKIGRALKPGGFLLLSGHANPLLTRRDFEGCGFDIYNMSLPSRTTFSKEIYLVRKRKGQGTKKT